MPKVLDSSSLVGEIKALTKAAAPDGYLICNGSTISNSNSSYKDLFIFLYNNYSDSQLPVSGGRTGNALNDWNAGKTIQLPNLVGRTLIGSGTYTDAVAGSVTRTLGDGNIGYAAHPLGRGEIPSHAHGASTANYGGAHQHQVPVSTGADDNNHSNIEPGGADTGGIDAYWPTSDGGNASYQGNHSHSVSIGADNYSGSSTGSAHNNMQPSHVTNWIIRY